MKEAGPELPRQIAPKPLWEIVYEHNIVEATKFWDSL